MSAGILDGFQTIIPTAAAVLSEKRQILRLTQQEVANRAKITLRQYQRLESGERNILTSSFGLACRVIEALDIHTERIERAWEFANWRTHSDFYDAFILAKAKNEYPDVYNKCLSVTRKDALVALNVPTSRQNKLRAIVMWLCPPLIPFLLKIREKKSKVIITHR